MPTFNAGDPATEFKKFSAQNLRYHEKAFKNGISGKVIVQFIINPEGKLMDPVLVVSADPDLDKEALGVVSSSPLWQPNFQREKPVNVVFSFPINFKWGM